MRILHALHSHQLHYPPYLSRWQHSKKVAGKFNRLRFSRIQISETWEIFSILVRLNGLYQSSVSTCTELLVYFVPLRIVKDDFSFLVIRSIGLAVTVCLLIVVRGASEIVVDTDFPLIELCMYRTVVRYPHLTLRANQSEIFQPRPSSSGIQPSTPTLGLKTVLERHT